MSNHNCLTCALALWRRTTAGNLHPSGAGRCTWQPPELIVPKAMYFMRPPKPSGGYIDRHDPNRYDDCPTWMAKD